MKICFCQLSPSPHFKKLLTSTPFNVYKSETLPLETYDWLLVKVGEISVKAISQFAEKLPQTHVTLLVNKNQLKDPNFYNELLALEPNCSVLPYEQWKELFWLELRMVLTLAGVSKEIAELQKQSANAVQKLEKDVTLAENIQRSLLPRHAPKFPGLSIATKYLPAAGLGGDYFDIFEFGDKKRLGVLLADSKTHGMAAALLSVLLKLRVEEMKERFPDSKSFVEHLNREIQDYRDLSSLALLYGIFDRTTLTFTYTTAGKIAPIWCRDKIVLPVPLSHNPPLGGMNDFSYSEQTLSLRPGDFLLLHTDGLEIPAGGVAGNVAKAVERILVNHSSQPDAIELQNEFLAMIDRYRDSRPLPDDLTMIQLSIHKGAIYVAKQSG